MDKTRFTTTQTDMVLITDDIFVYDKCCQQDRSCTKLMTFILRRGYLFNNCDEGNCNEDFGNYNEDFGNYNEDFGNYNEDFGNCNEDFGNCNEDFDSTILML